MECDAAGSEAEDHEGDGVEEDIAAAEGVDFREGQQGEEEVCCGDGEGGGDWGGEADEGEDCGGEVHEGVLEG